MQGTINLDRIRTADYLEDGTFCLIETLEGGTERKIVFRRNADGGTTMLQCIEFQPLTADDADLEAVPNA